MIKTSYTKFVTTIVQNMVQNTSVRIFTSYYSSTPIRSEESLPNKLNKLYIRLGNTVVSISNVPRERLQAISRNICLAILIYHDFISSRVSAHEQGIQIASVSSFFRKRRKMYSRLDLNGLTLKLIPLAVMFKQCFPPLRLNLDCSPNVQSIMTSYSICLRRAIFLIEEQLKKFPQDGSQSNLSLDTCQRDN